MGRFDGILFDFGHTLFNSRSASACAAEFRTVNGGDLDEVAFASTWSEIRERSRSADELAKGRDLSAEAHRECWLALLRPLDSLAEGLATFIYEMESSARGWEPYPDAAHVLQVVSELGLPIGIVSDCGWDIRAPFAKHGLDGYVTSFELSYEHGRCKPAPELFLAACSNLDIAPSRALMVGDSWLTDGGAAGAGLTALVLPERDRAAFPALDMVLDLLG